jgi:hypothetical protein
MTIIINCSVADNIECGTMNGDIMSLKGFSGLAFVGADIVLVSGRNQSRKSVD